MLGSSALLLAHADPGNDIVGRLGVSDGLGGLEHLNAVRDRDIAAAQTDDEIRDVRVVPNWIQARPDLMEQDAAIVGRAMSEVAVDHADCLEASERGPQFLSREWTEPAQADVADLVALLPHSTDSRASGHGDAAQADQHGIRVIGHE